MSVYKRILIPLLACFFSASLAHAQLIEIAAAYLVNKAVAKGEKKETSAGKILFNVYLEEADGSLLSFLAGIRPLPLVWLGVIGLFSSLSS